MFHLDDQFLQSVGLGAMPDDQKSMFLDHLLEELELRIGTRLAESMSSEELNEFESLIEARDEPGALEWLETHHPDYRMVVSEELEKLKREVSASKDKILS